MDQSQEKSDHYFGKTGLTVEKLDYRYGKKGSLFWKTTVYS
jgi:hypothetical protein